MKKHRLETNNFMLEIGLTVFEEDVNIPTNCMLNTKINSDGFTATITMDTDLRLFQNFVNELLGVYNSLNGSAELKENYGSNSIIFEATSNGHIHVKGIVTNLCRNGYEQELKFENEFDQTYLKNFVNELNNDINSIRY